MKASEYAQKVMNLSKLYPWKYGTEGNLLIRNLIDIIALRQEFFPQGRIRKENEY